MNFTLRIAEEQWQEVAGSGKNYNGQFSQHFERDGSGIIIIICWKSMVPAISYEDVCRHVNKHFASRGGMPKQMLVAFVFCESERKIARDELFRVLPYWNNKSGKNIHFYFGGYYRSYDWPPDDIVVELENHRPPLIFSPKQFVIFCKQIEKQSNWTYSGGTDFMLVNCFYKGGNQEPQFDFDTSVWFTFEILRRRGIDIDIGMAFERIFKYSEQVVNWPFSRENYHNPNVLKNLCASLLIGDGGSKATNMFLSLCNKIAEPAIDKVKGRPWIDRLANGDIEFIRAKIKENFSTYQKFYEAAYECITTDQNILRLGNERPADVYTVKRTFIYAFAAIDRRPLGEQYFLSFCILCDAKESELPSIRKAK